MSSYWQLLLLIVPVYALIGIGVGVRRLGWLSEEADASLLKLVMNCLYPCFIFESVLNNAALKVPSNLAYAPLLGFGTIVVGFGISYWAAKWVGLEKGHGLRTFAFASGINNYGYIPLLLMAGLFGADSLGLLLVFNVGCEAAIWTVGILVLSGISPRKGWRKLFNGPVIGLILGLLGNLANIGPHLPVVALNIIHPCGVCAIPLGLILIGATLADYLGEPSELFSPRVSLLATFLRVGIFPVAILLLAKWLPCSLELKRVLVVQAAMPAGILLIVIVKHYGGQPLMAVRVVIATTVVGILTIPLWLKIGLGWLF